MSIKITRSHLLLTSCLFLIAATTFAQSNKPLAKFNWLLDSWKMTVKKGVLYEKWHYVNDSTFQSSSFIIKATGDTIPQEAVQFTSRRGQIYYTPTVPNQNNAQPVPFKITSTKANEFIAENPEHEFPQRIIYRLEAPKKLYASVDGMNKGKFSKEEYWMEGE